MFRCDYDSNNNLFRSSTSSMKEVQVTAQRVWAKLLSYLGTMKILVIWGSLLRLPSSWPRGARGRRHLNRTSWHHWGLRGFRGWVPKNTPASIILEQNLQKRLKVHTVFMFFARTVWHSKRFPWISHKISKNAWSVTFFMFFCKKSVTLQAFSMIFTNKNQQNVWSVTLFMFFEDFVPPEATTPL